MIQRIKEKNKVNEAFDEILENPDVVDKYVDERIINTKSAKTTEKIKEDAPKIAQKDDKERSLLLGMDKEKKLLEKLIMAFGKLKLLY